MASTAQSTHAAPGPQLDNRRMAAAGIDLIAPALALLALLAGGLLTLAVAAVVLGWTLFYFFALESGDGQTLGKRVMKLRVVTAEGGTPTMRQYATRNAVRAVDLPLVGLMAMLVSGDARQRLGDRAADTMVVDAGSSPSAPHAEPMVEDAKPAKAKRRSLGGPELKLPKRARRADATDPVAATAAPAEAPAAPEPGHGGRRTPGGPDLKLPSFSRSRKAAGPHQPKASRRTLGGPEIKLPSFGRRKRGHGTTNGDAPTAEAPTPVFRDPVEGAPAPPEPELLLPESEPEPEPGPGSHLAEPEVVDGVEPAGPTFDPFDHDAPAPSIEVTGTGDFTGPGATDPDTGSDQLSVEDDPEIQIPDIQVVRPDLDPEPPARRPPAIPAAPAEPTRPPAIPAAELEEAQNPLYGEYRGAPAVPDEPASAGASDPRAEESTPTEPEPSDAVRDDGSPRLSVKPIQTVSPLELLMQESEEREQPDDRPPV